ncbi:MAG TPA: hypothetical protein VE011_09725 [Candidatus Dormibacteraeota bacterium]|nr:hypothetical protein [Candidatus Dormibacteraeota bacterium]
MGEASHVRLTGWVGFSTIAVAAAGLILVAGRGMGFYNDEWWFILGRSISDPVTWFAAHNEHWVTLHVIVYLGLHQLVGESSYLPYLAALMAVHVSAAAALFILVRRIRDGWAPLAVTSIFLVLGSGFENLFWGFQMGMVGGLSLGLWALVAVPRRPIVAAVLLLAGVATSGSVLFGVAAACVYLLLTRPRWAAITLLPVAAYGVWWVVIGAATARNEHLPFNLGWTLGYPGNALGAWMGGVTGLGFAGGLAVLLVTPYLLYRSRPLNPLVLASIAAITAEVAVLTLSRSAINSPWAPRYVYLCAPWALIVASAMRLPTLVARPAFAWALAVNLLLVVYWGHQWPIERGNPPVTCQPAAVAGASVCETNFAAR